MRSELVFSIRAVPGTDVGLVWTLDIDRHQVILAMITG